jgi:hypothetical protein
MLGQVVVLIVLVLMVALSLYLWRVPAGPACPRCGTLTRHRALAGSRGPWRLPALRFAAAECPACGWRGRLRRQPPEPVRARSGRAR